MTPSSRPEIQTSAHDFCIPVRCASVNNIKNSAAEEALRRLTALTGETQAAAVERSAIERIERLESGARRERIRLDVAEIQRLIVESGGRMTTDDLYDNSGLPR